MSIRYTPEPAQIDYQSEIQERRVQHALKLMGKSQQTNAKLHRGLH